MAKSGEKERSQYLCEQYQIALGEELKRKSSNYVLDSLNKAPQNKEKLKAVNSEYLLRELRRQSEENPNISRDAPHRPFLIGTPVSAKEIRAKIESFDNQIVVPQIFDGKVYFSTHTEADVHTAIEGNESKSNISENNEHVDLSKVNFSFAQLIRLLGPSTCQRLEREFIKQNKLSEIEMAQLKTARESIESIHSAKTSENIHTAQSREPNLLSVKTAQSREPNLLSVKTAQSREPNLLSAYTANSVEPNLLSVYSARSPGLATRIFGAQSPGIHTANSLEPNMLSVRTANSLEPNLLSVHSAKSPGLATKIFAKSPGMLTAQNVEPNLLSTRTAVSSMSDSSLNESETNLLNNVGFEESILYNDNTRSSKDVQTALEIESIRSSQDVRTALEILSSIESSKDVQTAQEIESIRSSQDVRTALEILSSIESSKDVQTAQEIDSTIERSKNIEEAQEMESNRSTKNVQTAKEIENESTILA